MTELTARRGDTFLHAGVVMDAAETPENLTGGKLWFTMKESVRDDDGAAVASAYWVSGGASDGITVTNAATGAFVLALPPDVTTTWQGDRTYQYDVQYRSSSGRVTTVDRGTVAVESDVTRRLTTP